MKIRVYSDIHLDWYAGDANSTRIHDPELLEDPFKNFWYPPELPDDKETILVLAGDLWVGTKWIEWMEEFSWIGRVAPRFKQVLIVLGNHDYWPQGGLTISKGAEKCNDMLGDRCLFNVKVLDRSTFEIDGVLFIGATLWTDMDKHSAFTMFDMPRYMRYDGKISYDVWPDGGWSRFTSDKWVQTHDKHKAYRYHSEAK